eukprot:811691-Rhodomonas_salina.2
MKRCKDEAESKGSASSSEDEESFDMYEPASVSLIGCACVRTTGQEVVPIAAVTDYPSHTKRDWVSLVPP